MKVSPLRERRGRKPAWMLRLARRPTCRRCPLRLPSGECRHSGLWSGRCGDKVWYVVGGKQRHRRYARPADPRTARQRLWRARLGAASAAYSDQLTDEQQILCIAKGARRRCRPRLGPSGRFTGHQYWVRGELSGKPGGRRRKTARTTQVPQLQRVIKKFHSQAPQPQPLTRSTWGHHQLPTSTTPAQHRRNTKRRGKDMGRRKNAECRRQKGRPSTARWQLARNSGLLAVSRRTRGRSPFSRKCAAGGQTRGFAAARRWQCKAAPDKPASPKQERGHEVRKLASSGRH